MNQGSVKEIEAARNKVNAGVCGTVGTPGEAVREGSINVRENRDVT